MENERRAKGRTRAQKPNDQQQRDCRPDIGDRRLAGRCLWCADAAGSCCGVCGADNGRAQCRLAVSDESAARREGPEGVVEVDPNSD